MLKCYTCKQDKPEEEFYTAKNSRGFQSNCKACMKAYHKNYVPKEKPPTGIQWAEELLRFPLNG